MSRERTVVMLWSKACAAKKAHEKKLDVAQMQIIRGMCEVLERKSSWCGHMLRREDAYLLRKGRWE